MKKILLGIGVITTMMIPIIAVVSCGIKHGGFLDLNKKPKDFMYRTYNNAKQVGVFTKDKIVNEKNSGDELQDKEYDVFNPEHYIGNIEFGYGKDIE